MNQCQISQFDHCTVATVLRGCSCSWRIQAEMFRSEGPWCLQCTLKCICKNNNANNNSNNNKTYIFKERKQIWQNIAISKSRERVYRCLLLYSCNFSVGLQFFKIKRYFYYSKSFTWQSWGETINFLNYVRNAEIPS